MAREITDKLLGMIDEGRLDRDLVITACLKYMSEAEVEDMIEANEFFQSDEDYYEPEISLQQEYDDLPWGCREW